MTGSWRRHWQKRYLGNRVEIRRTATYIGPSTHRTSAAAVERQHRQRACRWPLSVISATGNRSRMAKNDNVWLLGVQKSQFSGENGKTNTFSSEHNAYRCTYCERKIVENGFCDFVSGSEKNVTYTKLEALGLCVSPLRRVFTNAAIWRVSMSSRFISINHFPYLPVVTNPEKIPVSRRRSGSPLKFNHLFTDPLPFHTKLWQTTTIT